LTRNLVGKTIAHYRILSLLGEGGMGVVYRAMDTKLQREVALKFLSSRMIGDAEDRERFLNEARAAASLDHPNICAVHEIGEVDGLAYISMARLEGESLKDRLARGALDRDEAVDIARQIAEGMSEAHAGGVVHRDLKPGNIMISPKGRAVIMDFGLAKTSRSPDLTRAGLPVGTAAYMSPEQARGQKVDARSDVWALGALLYEMLMGSKAFEGKHEPGIIYALCHERPAGLEPDHGTIDPGLKKILDRCLRKDPKERYESARELKDALVGLIAGASDGGADGRLRWIAWITVPLLILSLLWIVLAGRGFGWMDRLAGEPPIPARKYLAILPFENIGADPDNQALGDGLHQYLSSKLAQLEGFRDAFWVVPAADIRKSEIVSPMEARQVFGVNLAVAGSVQRRDGSITLTLNLTAPESHRTLNSTVLEGSSSEASVLQADVLNKLVEMLRVQLSPEERAALGSGRTSVSLAQEHYLQGRGFMQDLDYLQRHAKLDAVDTAVDFFRQALREDPHYALAESGLGEALWQRYLWSREEKWIPMAVSHCERALELDPLLQEARISLAVVFRGTGKPDRAEALLNEVLAADPGNIRALRELGECYAQGGRVEKADSTLRRAIRIRPGDWVGHQVLGRFYADRFRFDEAISEFKHVLDLTPENYFRGYTDLAGVYLYQQRLDEARKLLERSVAIRASYSALSNLGTLHYMQEDYGQAIKAYRGALALHDHDYRIWGNLASAEHHLEQLEKQSREDFTRAAELAEEQRVITPEDPGLLSRLASYYQALDRKPEAVTLLEKLAELDSGNAETLFQISQTYEQMGEREKAMAWLKTALSKGYPLSKIENTPSLQDLLQDERWSGPSPAKEKE